VRDRQGRVEEKGALQGGPRLPGLTLLLEDFCPQAVELGIQPVRLERLIAPALRLRELTLIGVTANQQRERRQVLVPRWVRLRQEGAGLRVAPLPVQLCGEFVAGLRRLGCRAGRRGATAGAAAGIATPAVAGRGLAPPFR